MKKYSGIIIFTLVLAFARINVAEAALGDGASSNIKLLDANQNGYIDQITFDINNPNLESWRTHGSLPYGLAVTQDGTPMYIVQVNIDSISTNPAKVRITLAEGSVLSTDGVVNHPVELSYLPNGNVNSGSNINDGVDELLNQINSGDSGSSDTEIDSAKPVLQRADFQDINSDGRVETIRTYWSEGVMSQGATYSDWQIGKGSINAQFVTAIYDSSPGETLDIGIIANLDQTSSAALPTIKYLGIRQAVFDQGNNSGLESTVINVADAAPPAIIKALPGDYNGDGTADFLAVTFSENTLLGGDRRQDYFTISYNGINRTISRDSYQSPATQINFYINDMPVNNLGAIYSMAYFRNRLGYIRDLSNNEMPDQFHVQSQAPTTIQSVEVTPSGLNVLQTGPLKLNFTTNLTLPVDMKIKLNLISGFNFISPISTYCQGIRGLFNGFINNPILTLGYVNNQELAPGVYSCDISTVRNPDKPGAYGPYTLELTSNDDVVLSFAGSIPGDTITGSTAVEQLPTQIISAPPTVEAPVYLGMPSGGEYLNPENRADILARQNIAVNSACEQQYLPLVKSDAAIFSAILNITQENAALTFVCYGISQETKNLGAGERRALLRDYFQTLFRDRIYWDDVATNVLAQKPIHRNLTKEQAQVGSVLAVFRKIYGHDPIFTITDQDLAWNTLMYRIRFPRDLTEERSGILKFVSLYGRNPISPLDWSAVRVLGYIKK